MPNDDNDWLEHSSETADSTYSPDSFYIRSTNKKGFGKTVRINVPPEALAQIAELIASRRIPDYRTSADFYRDAMVHRLHWVTEQLEGGSPLQVKSTRLRDRLIAESDMERMEMMIEWEKRIIEKAQYILRNVSEYNQAEAVEYIRSILPQIRDPRLKEQLIAELSRFN